MAALDYRGRLFCRFDWKFCRPQVERGLCKAFGLVPGKSNRGLRSRLQFRHSEQLQWRIRELRFDLGEKVFHSQTVFPAQVLDIGSVLDELIGPADLHDGSGNSYFVVQLQNRAAIS